MKVNRSTLLYHLVVFCGFCTAIQGVEFPIKIETLKYEGAHVTPKLYDKYNSGKIAILRNGSNDKWFDIWISPSSNTQPQHAFTFQVIEMYAFVVKVLSVLCHSSLSDSVLTMQVAFHSRDDAKRFRYEEIFLKNTRVLSSVGYNFHARAGSSAPAWRSDYFEFELKDVLLYNGIIAAKLVQNAILDRVLIKNYKNEIVSQFHIRRTDDTELSSTEVIFTEGYFNVSHSLTLERFVLSIWMNNQTTSHICLIFADQDHADFFLENISSYLQPSPNIRYGQRNELFHTDMSTITGIC